MEPIAELLKALADKLGTTTQYLWTVLVKQAPIDATLSLIQMIILGSVTYVFIKKHKKFVSDEAYDEDFYPVVMILGAVVLVIIWIIAFFSIPTMFNGFFNPEYWALHKVLSMVVK